MISDDLQKIFEDDEDGLLNSPDKIASQTPDERLVNSFMEISSFFEEHGYEPRSATNDISERRLFSRLNAMRRNEDKIKILKDFDTHELLKPTGINVGIDEILDDDLLDDDTGILTIRNVPKEISKPEYVGRQRHCPDFAKFETKFKKVHQELTDSKRKIIEFKHQSQIVEGSFFVLRGVLVYVDKVGERKTSVNGLEDARLRLIFENGTESDILLLSFAKALFLDGRLITVNEDTLLDNFKGLGSEDEESGYIYILSTLSDKSELQNMHDLYKIGFSTKSVEERIKVAAQDPTYLMAPVKIVATYKCYNMSTQKFEHLLHRVFSKARLNLEVIGLNKDMYVPDEWFIVPIEVIDQAVNLIISDQIVDYTYNELSQKLEFKKDHE